ncbi:MAG: TetR/AcrR family transcriptional regulator [Smithella sp.]
MNERNKHELINLRRAQLTRAAYKVVGEKGYSDFTIKDIAREAGLSTGLVHYYFKNKEDLLFKLLKGMNDNLKRDLNKALTVLDDPREKLLAFCNEAFDLVHKEKAYFSVLVDFLAQINRNRRIHQAIVKLFQSYRDEIVAILKEGVAKGVFTVVDVQLTSVIIVSLIQGNIFQHLIDQEAFDYSVYMEKTKEQIFSLVMKGQ